MAVSKKTYRKKKVAPDYRRNKRKKKEVPYSHKPMDMTEDEWQIALRKQIAVKEIFGITNIGYEEVYSDYNVHSAKSNKIYKVAIRSEDNKLNYCSCFDFKTNQLGTCKHIEAVWAKIKKKRGIKPLIKEVPAISYTSMFISYAGMQKVKLRIGTENAKQFKEWAKKYFTGNYTLLPQSYDKIDVLLQEAQAIHPTFRCYDDALQRILEVREKHKRQQLAENEDILEDVVAAKLFPYQQKGVLFAFKAGRAILADEMGLGKTLQAIAWAMLMRKETNTEKAVIVCPTSLKYQWKSEIEKFTDGKATVTVVEGNLTARMRLYETDESFFKIVSYHVAGSDWKYINEMQPDIIILDEAQRIKNWRTKTSFNIKQLQSPYALVLTGTPLENKIEELYSIVQFVNPLLLGSLYKFLSAHALTDDETGKVTGYKALNEIGEQLSDILIRRRKKEVLMQLPKRMDKNLFVPMTPIQAEMHSEYQEIVAKLVHKWRRMRFLSEQDRQKLMVTLNLMRMVCDSTYIVDQETNHQTKLNELFNILEEILAIEGEKIVVFSQWERMTRLVANELTAKGVGFEHLHGGVPGNKREKLFTNFNNDPQCRIFLSTDAGGVGLNLQSAAYLINLDIPWNPAVLEQRIGRIYRMGQKKNVSIINLVSQDTIEHGMLARLKFKATLAEGVLDNGDDCIFLGEDRFKAFMETVEEITKVDDIVQPQPYTFDETEESEISENGTRPDEPLNVEDVIKMEDNESSDNKNGNEQTKINDSSETLINTGMSFFSKLVQTLADKSATEELVKTITEKDEKTGKTYIKLPVENEDIITNGLNLLAGLLKGFK